jgi:hypothetical protein
MWQQGIADWCSSHYPAVRVITSGFPARAMTKGSLLPQLSRLRPKERSAPLLGPRRLPVGPAAAAIAHGQRAIQRAAVGRIMLERDQDSVRDPGLPPAPGLAVEGLPCPVPFEQIASWVTTAHGPDEWAVFLHRHVMVVRDGRPVTSVGRMPATRGTSPSAPASRPPSQSWSPPRSTRFGSSATRSRSPSRANEWVGMETLPLPYRAPSEQRDWLLLGDHVGACTGHRR